jgi:hypothetical protein
VINRGAIELVAQQIVRLASQTDGWELPTAREMLRGIGLHNLDAIKTNSTRKQGPCIELEEIDVSEKNRTQRDQLEAIFALVDEIVKHHNVRVSLELVAALVKIES